MTALSTTSDSGTRSDEIVIDAQDIHVEYRLNSLHSTTLKEHVIGKLYGKSQWVKTHALKGVSLVAKKGECVAFIGHNGCGKSTFLKVLAGILKPARGSLFVKGRVAPLIELGAGFDPELTGRENVYLSCSLMGLTRAEIDERMESIYDFSELNSFFDAPIKTYSSGMYMRLGFSCSTAIDADLLLIDEILAVGDENFQRKCMERMHSTRNSGVTSILVTHDLNVVQSMADRVLVIDHGSMVFSGHPREAIAFYRELMENERLSRLSESERKEELRRRKLLENEHRTRDQAQGDARLIAARICDAQGVESVAVIPAGKPWTLRIDLEVKHGFPEPPVIGYAILNRDGVRTFGGNTREASKQPGFPNFSRPGVYSIDFSFSSMPLASAEYRVLTAIHDHRLEATIDLQDAAARLAVLDSADTHNFDHDLIGPVSRSVAVSCRAPT